ncbi:MAG: hypothetical protein HY661_01875 [Betaproteobacteria bacterium]|nr:hypothetical protein [Betaproteobacteria bacterium]
MKPVTLMAKCAAAFVFCGILAAGSVMADKPSSAGAGKGAGKSARMDQRDVQKAERRDGDSRSAGKRKHFEDRHHVIVRDYYVTQFRSGRCPPGLAKKQNGCMPPGQAKKWQMGRPLPRDVIFYDVPQSLVVQIGIPPSGHRYVRVATDILLIAIGTGMVIDAIEDLGR